MHHRPGDGGVPGREYLLAGLQALAQQILGRTVFSFLAQEHAEIEQARARREQQDKELTLEVESAGAVSAPPPLP